MMAGDIDTAHAVPSDFDQMRTVWKYEILKYLRSKRLFATLAIVGVILALIYILPPVLGENYSGTDSGEVLSVVPADFSMIDPADLEGALYVGFIERDTIESGTIELSRNGMPYPSQNGANWVYRSIDIEGHSRNTVLIMDDIGGSEIAATYDWHVSAESFDSNFLSFVSILIVICAVGFAADSLVGEFQSRTGYLIFPNAIKRETLFFGKFMASISMGIVVVALFYAVVAVLSLVSARGIDDDFLLSFAFAVAYVLATMGIAYFISAVMKGTTGAIVLTFFLLIMILPIVDSVSMFSGTKIEASVTFAAGTIVYILNDPYPVDEMMDIGMMEVHSYYPTPATAAIVLLAYAAISCVLSAMIFKRKQLAG
jgi:ABC-2 type transport system permease protein